VLLSATVPAIIDLLLVPTLASLYDGYFTQHGSGGCSRAFGAAVKWLEIIPRVSTGRADSLQLIDIDGCAEHIVLRSLAQLSVLLQIALTFGLAAPVVGVACALGAAVQLIHHLSMLGRVVDIGRLRSPPAAPYLACTSSPMGCAFTTALCVLLFWTWASCNFLDPILMSIGVVVAIFTSFLVMETIRRYNKQNTESSIATGFSLTESLLLNEEAPKECRDKEKELEGLFELQE
jgi:hypothetical protein